MRVKVTHRAGRIHNAHSFDMVLGEVYDIELTEVVGRISWQADNDEVLAIDDDSGLKGRITATAIGKSTIEFKQRGRVVGDLHIEAYEQPAVTVTITSKGNRTRT